MSGINMEELKRYIDVPPNAERLLSKSEKEITFSLNLYMGEGKMLEASTYVIYANVARGPAKGGIRMAPTVTLEEVRDLAWRMVWKTALSGIPFGGGKSGICLDAKALTRFEKTAVMKEYVHMISAELLSGEYVPAPDLGTGPYDMAVIYGETHILESVTGKPPRVGGLPGREEATGWGAAHATRLAMQQIIKKDLSGAKIAVQGFGNVASWASCFLHEAGAKVVTVSGSKGGIYDERGLDIPRLVQHVQQGESIQTYDADEISNKDLLELDVDVLIPAAVENQITKENAPRIGAKLIIEGANGPTTRDADKILDERGIIVIPDILANCGGVVASYVEWRKAKSGTLTEARETYDSIAKRIDAAFDRMLTVSKDRKVSNRVAAEIIAVSEVISAMEDRGWI